MKLLTTIFLMSFLNSFGRDISISDSLFDEHLSQVNLIEDVINFQKNHPRHSIPKRIDFKTQIIFVGCQPSIIKDSVLQVIETNLNKSFEGSSIHIDVQRDVFQIPLVNASIDYSYKHYDESFDNECYKKDFINVYIFEKLGNNVAGFAQYPNSSMNRICMDVSSIYNHTLEHEFGHYFGLLHTFDRTYAVRESNHQLDGDMIEDTPTDVFGGGAFFEESCEFAVEYKDSNGDVYKPDFTNYMSYYGNCRNRFTPKQLERMSFFAWYRKQKSLIK